MEKSISLLDTTSNGMKPEKFLTAVLTLGSTLLNLKADMESAEKEIEMSNATTYTVGRILKHKHAVCEETGVQ